MSASEAQFGYETVSSLANPSSGLFFQRLRARYHAHRSAVLAHPETMYLSNRPTLSACEKMGRSSPLSIHLTPLTTTHGIYVVASSPTSWVRMNLRCS